MHNRTTGMQNGLKNGNLLIEINFLEIENAFIYLN